MLFVVIFVCTISFVSEVQSDVCCVPDQYQSFSSGMFGSVKDGQPNLVNVCISADCSILPLYVCINNEVHQYAYSFRNYQNVIYSAIL